MVILFFHFFYFWVSNSHEKGRCKIGEEGTKLIFEALRKNSTLQILSMSYYSFIIHQIFFSNIKKKKQKETEEMESEWGIIPDILKHNSTLTELQLSDSFFLKTHLFFF